LEHGNLSHAPDRVLPPARVCEVQHGLFLRATARQKFTLEIIVEPVEVFFGIPRQQYVFGIQSVYECGRRFFLISFIGHFYFLYFLKFVDERAGERIRSIVQAVFSLR
jgi:hypothetical protein